MKKGLHFFTMYLVNMVISMLKFLFSNLLNILSLKSMSFLQYLTKLKLKSMAHTAALHFLINFCFNFLTKRTLGFFLLPVWDSLILL